MRELITYYVTWWAWGIPALAIIVGTFTWLARLFGVRNALIGAGTLAFGIILKLAETKGRQSGWKDREEHERKKTKKAKETIEDAFIRANNSINSNPDRLRESDGHRRVD